MTIEETPYKIFAINDCDWYAAKTMEEAIEQAVKDYLGPSDEIIDNPKELSLAEMQTFQFYTEDSSRISFAEQLQIMIEKGEKFPCMFASTEY